MMNTNNDEIDLVELVKNILSFISKNKWVIIGVFILGSALGYYQSKNKEKKSQNIYHSQYIVETHFLSGNEIYMVGRQLAESNKQGDGEELFNSINEIDCLKDVIEGKEPEINMVFKTTSELDVKDLIHLMRKRIQSNENYKTNLEEEIKHNDELLKLINNQIAAITKDKGSLSKDSKEFLTYIELLEKKQELEKKINVTKTPIMFLPIEPLNKLEPGYKFIYVSVLAYGIILSIFSVLIILFIRLIKLVRA